MDDDDDDDGDDTLSTESRLSPLSSRLIVLVEWEVTIGEKDCLLVTAFVTVSFVTVALLLLLLLLLLLSIDLI